MQQNHKDHEYMLLDNQAKSVKEEIATAINEAETLCEELAEGVNSLTR
jgi:hypothetical protein